MGRKLGSVFGGTLNWLSRDRRPIERYAMAVAIVLASAGLADVLYKTLNTTRLSMVFLAGVVVAAATQGARAAYLAAGLAFCIYNYYLVEPRFTLRLVSAEDYIVLVVFLFVAVLTGALAGRVRDEADRAQARAAAANTLHAASSALSSIGDAATIRRQLARHVAAAAQAPAYVLGAEGAFGAPDDAVFPAAVIESLIRMTGGAAGSGTEPRAAPEWRMRLLRDDEPALGAVAWKSSKSDLAALENQRLLNVLVDVGASAIVRATVNARQSELEALARTEQLRNALLSSVSHDFRTPLSAILASATSLRALSDDLDRPTRDDLLAIIQEEAERLNRFIANLLQMSQLESGVLHPSQDVLDLEEVVDRLVQRLGRGRAEARLQAISAAPNMLVRADPILLEHALTNVIENALRYSANAGAVRICTGRHEDQVFIEVVDEGPGVAPDQIHRIFDKFFQGGGAQREPSGAGLGLSIARGLVEAMQGSITAANRKGAAGLSVRLAFPACA